MTFNMKLKKRAHCLDSITLKDHLSLVFSPTAFKCFFFLIFKIFLILPTSTTVSGSPVPLCGHYVTLQHDSTSVTTVESLGESAVVRWRRRNIVVYSSTAGQACRHACAPQFHRPFPAEGEAELGKMCGMSVPLLKALLAWLHVFIC